MTTVASILIAVVAILHAGFLVLEMFFWGKPIGLRTFRQSPERAAATKVLAANQGLYNGSLAGVHGALGVSRRILYIQALPAALALGLLWGSR